MKFAGYFSAMLAFFTFPVLAGTNCQPDEIVYFSCAIKETQRVVSLCGSPGSTDESGQLQYRFGRVQRPELVFPSDETGSLDMFEVEWHYHAPDNISADYVSFTNGDYTYTVASITGDGDPGQGESYTDFHGIRIEKRGKRIAELSCAGEPDANRLREAIFMVEEASK